LWSLSAVDFNQSFRDFHERGAAPEADHRLSDRRDAALPSSGSPSLSPIFPVEPRGAELCCRAMSTGTKHAVVTGAGSGIGRATALALLADGWSVALAGRRPEPLHATAEAAAEGRDRALVVPTDVRNPPEVRALFARATAAFGRVDVLFNNAGMGSPPAAFEDITPEQWRSVIDVNLTGMFLCAQAAFRAMRDQSPRGGRIINNGSLSAHVPRPSSAPYTASKHAITGLTKCIALDGRKYDISCSQLDIGNAATELTERMERGVPQANGATLAEPRMDVGHVGSSVVHIANLPPTANVLFMTLMATKMPFVGRG
jgi:NAD(P)-dependent dehydrogenase (short-subunit alcohol dehydrogenase family)